MPAIIRSEFALALNQVAAERGIDINIVLDTIKAAILAAYRKDYGTDSELELLTVEINPDNGEAKIFKDGKNITPPGFGRIAAQTAKQVILQRIREAEKQAVLADYQTKVGVIVSGMILRFDGHNIIVDIGKAQGLMPPAEQSSGDRYNLNQRLTFYIEGIRETMRGSEIIVSRVHKGLVEGLFKREVPEVAQGSVEIKNIAREAGGRTKVAVYSTQAGVDPVGSCVGQKGVRVQAVINELGGSEKVDIIQWSEDVKQYIIAALAPAKDLEVKLDEKSQTAQVKVPEDQLSLAIGKDGQNVRLAAKLTGWKIDMVGKKPAKIQKTDSSESSAGKEDKKPAALEDKSKDENPKSGADTQKENPTKENNIDNTEPIETDSPSPETDSKQ